MFMLLRANKTPSLAGGSLAAYPRRGRVQQIAPGVYKLHGTDGGSRMVRILAVHAVSAPTHTGKLHDTCTHHGGSIFYGLGATGMMRRAGVDVASDGCKVKPGTYCSHGFPSQSVLWGY